MVEIGGVDEVVTDATATDATATDAAKAAKVTRKVRKATAGPAAEATADLVEGRAAVPTGSARSAVPGTGRSPIPVSRRPSAYDPVELTVRLRWPPCPRSSSYWPRSSSGTASRACEPP